MKIDRVDLFAVRIPYVRPIKFAYGSRTVGDYLIVAASMGRKTPGQALAGVFSTHCVNQWKPSRVALLGIAGSLEPDRIQLGDVLVSHEIYGYEVGDAEVGEIHFRPTFNQIGALDLDRVRAFRDDPGDYPNWQKECLVWLRYRTP
jgi:nucleoside phosphorylase